MLSLYNASLLQIENARNNFSTQSNPGEVIFFILVNVSLSWLIAFHDKIGYKYNNFF
jgi:hypothetical protein